MFGIKRKNRKTPPIFTSKLGLEMLETRENPANFYWDPLSASNLSSQTAANWVDADGDRGGSVQQNGQTVPGPTSSDTLIFGAVVGGLPNYSNPSPGGGGVGTTGGSGGANTLDCYLYSVPYNGSPGQVNAQVGYFGWTLLAGYGTGTVHLQQSSSVSYYEMHGGNLDQVPVSGGTNEVTVYNLLNWTKGTINTNSVPGKLTIHEGASGWIEPLNGGEVETNNTLTIDGDEENEIGGNVTQAGGTLVLNMAQQIIVNAFAGFVLTNTLPASPPPGSPPASPSGPATTLPGAEVSFLGVKSGKADVVLAENAYMRVKKVDTDATKRAFKVNNGYIHNDGGLLDLREKVLLEIQGSSQGTDAFSYRQDSIKAKTVIRNDSVLASTSAGIEFLEGKLIVACTAGEKVGTIAVPENKKVIFDGDTTIRICAVDPVDVFGAETPVALFIGTLKIDGSLVWKGSAAFCTLTNSAGVADSIHVTQNVTFEGTPKVKPYWITDALPQSKQSWSFFKADGGIVNQGVLPITVSAGVRYDSQLAVTSETFEVHVSADRKELFIYRKT